MRIYVGIDPGAQGAVAFLYDRGGRLTHRVRDIPTYKKRRVGGKRTEFDVPGIVKMFRFLKPVSGKVRVCIEDMVIQIPGRGNSAYVGARVGYAYGLLEGVLASLGLDYAKARPNIWKRDMQLWSKDKEVSRLQALKLFPRAKITRKKDHNRAEALLLAEYMRRKCKGLL